MPIFKINEVTHNLHMHFKEQIITVAKENKTCHLYLCMAPRKAMGFWVHAHLSLMTSLHTSCTVWTYRAQRAGYSNRGASASSPLLTIPPGLFLFSFSLKSIQTVPLFSPLPPDATGASLSCWESPEWTPLFSDTLHACKWGAICSSLLALGHTSWWQGDFCLLWYALYHFYLHFNSSI